MSRLALCVLSLCLGSATIVMPVPASAGEILRATPASDFKWRTTECRKPIQNTSPAVSHQKSVAQYAEDITKYLACLQQEAQRDFNKSQALMQAAIERELEAETKRMDDIIRRAYNAR